MKKSIIISVIILIILLSLFILATGIITKYTGFAVTGNIIKEEIPEKCTSINKYMNNNSCNKGG